MSAGAPGGRGTILFAYGFRVFFLLAGVHAALAMAVWLAVAAGRAALPGDWPPALWHGHEMVFGYVAAVIAGFVLTAAPTWTGGAPIRGGALALLAALWLAGRAAMAATGLLPGFLVASLDLAFLPALALAVTPSLVRARQWRNLVVPAIVLLLAAINVWVHAGAAGLGEGEPRGALDIAVDVLILLVALIGGRIIPAFTRNAIARAGEDPRIAPHPLVDAAAMAALGAVVVADLVIPGTPVAALLAVLAGGLHGLRASRWRPLWTRRQPLLWVLHLGYAFLVAGLVVKGLGVVLTSVPADSGRHLLTAGAVGVITLAVMSRVALGHTGRALEAAPPTVLAYRLVAAGGLLRALAPILPGAFVQPAILTSGLFWSVGFALFVAVYFPILTAPRVDGRPG